MEKLTQRSPFVLFFTLIVILTLSACKLFTPKSAGLRLDKRADDGRVSGSYQYSKDIGTEMIKFSVNKEGLATFRLENAPEAETLTVDLSDVDTAHLDWQGKDLDGLGSLSGEEQVVLDNLMDSKLAHGLAMLPLDIACQGEDKVDPVQVAALLYPLQMRFKYQITERSAVASELIALSQCDYGTGTEDPDRYPSVILMMPSSPVPVVMGYFPFDDVGAVSTSTTGESSVKLACLDPSAKLRPASAESGAQLPDYSLLGSEPIRDEWGPCEAKCRGACGPDCTINNCKLSVEDRCEKNQDGNNDGFVSMIYSYNCGLHPACIKHDACYDDCNQHYGCSSWAATFCMHSVTLVSAPFEYFTGSYLSCDSATLLEEAPSNVKDWVRGYGPWTTSQVYEYTDKKYRYEYDPVTCPLREEEGEEAGASTEEPEGSPAESDIPVETYMGTGDWFAERRKEGTESITSEVIISVAEDGTVTGSLSQHMIEITYYNEQDDCSGHWEHFLNGTFSGQLTGNSGVIVCTQELTAKNFSSCPDANPGYNGTFIQSIDIEIPGDVITGSSRPVPDDPDDIWMFTFTAIKQ